MTATGAHPMFQWGYDHHNWCMCGHNRTCHPSGGPEHQYRNMKCGHCDCAEFNSQQGKIMYSPCGMMWMPGIDYRTKVTK